MHVVVRPGKPRVGIDAQGDELSDDRDEPRDSLGRVVRYGRVADVVHRLPAARAAGFRGQRRILFEPSLHAPRGAQNERRVEVRFRDPRMQRQNTLGAITAPIGGRFEKLIDRRIELEREGFHMLPQRVPRREAVLARDHRLSVVERERCLVEGFVGNGRERGERPKSPAGAGNVAAGGLEQVLG